MKAVRSDLATGGTPQPLKAGKQPRAKTNGGTLQTVSNIKITLRETRTRQAANTSAEELAPLSVLFPEPSQSPLVADLLKKAPRPSRRG